MPGTYSVYINSFKTEITRNDRQRSQNSSPTAQPQSGNRPRWHPLPRAETPCLPVLPYFTPRTQRQEYRSTRWEMATCVVTEMMKERSFVALFSRILPSSTIYYGHTVRQLVDDISIGLAGVHKVSTSQGWFVCSCARRGIHGLDKRSMRFCTPRHWKQQIRCRRHSHKEG